MRLLSCLPSWLGLLAGLASPLASSKAATWPLSLSTSLFNWFIYLLGGGCSGFGVALVTLQGCHTALELEEESLDLFTFLAEAAAGLLSPFPPSRAATRPSSLRMRLLRSSVTFFSCLFSISRALNPKLLSSRTFFLF